MSEKILTQEILREFLVYCADTGLFIWVKRSARCTILGDIAGSINREGYRRIRFKGKEYRASRLAFLYMTGAFPEFCVDHINHIRDDDRWRNLRLASVSENTMNKSLGKKNTTGFIGVSFITGRKQWRAGIGSDYRTYNLGDYIELWDAICARKSAEYKYNFHKNHGGICSGY